MLTKIILIISSLSILMGASSCQTKVGQPKMPNIKTCRLIKGASIEEDFMSCRLYFGGEFYEEVIIKDIPKVPETSKDIWICTTMNNDAAMRAYARETQKWIDNNCQIR